MRPHPRRSAPTPILGLLLLLAVPRGLAAQASVASTGRLPQHGTTVPASATSVQAIKIDQAPVIDGFDTDAIWAGIPAQSGFRESRPTEDGDPKQRTEFKVAYDAKNLYVFVRAFDAHPDSIIKLLSRRDDFTPSDQLMVMIDSYHDRRTGYEFIVNPAGVKVDNAISNDGNE
ncbi:MAG TPA: carbohydrate binding family 9 domain-containing protein, partial [Gemmatimonadales bacterium]|nr:carbohydrate binding family 9 domain-containing protein [Gemmatimonadales bacterium]